MIPTLANHLWQSTLFAAATGLLAVSLRKNQARVRYWLWLTASVKFLIPFSLLAAIGGHVEWSTAAPKAQPELSIAMEQISQPFAQASTGASAAPAVLVHNLLPALLLAVWTCGFLAVTFSWWRRWRCIRAAMRLGSPLSLKAEVPVLSSPGLLEPGVFRIFRPVLLLPEGIADCLEPAQLEVIVAHEMCHVRRRDNLAAAIHMAVEAIFWFYPLVWWLGARLVEERERACDEEVLRLGSEPEVYAESILKTCQFYLESPLVCMSGITGSDLKTRIVRIMTQGVAKKLSLSRKLLLAAAGMAAVAGPIAFGILNAPQSRAQTPAATSTHPPAFEVASIKPNHGGGGKVMFRIAPGGRFAAENVTLKLLLEQAYGVKDSQISGAPGWIDAEHYDIEAKPEDSSADEKRKPTPEEQKARLMLMLQSMLADRFKLTVHHDTKELQEYALVVAKNGPKLHETADTPSDAAPPSPPGPPGGPTPKGFIRMMGRGQLEVNGVTLGQFADVLSRQLGRIVVDKTELKGKYEFALKWTPDEGQGQMFGGPGGGADGKPPGDAAPPPDASGPSIFAALQEQLGLKLESQKGLVDTIVIDHVERPSEN